MQINPSVPVHEPEKSISEVEKASVRRRLRRVANKSGWMLTAFLVLSNGIAFGALWLFRRLCADILPDQVYASLTTLISTMAMYLGAMPLILLFYNHRSEHTLRTYFTRPNARPGTMFKWIVIGAGCAYATNYIMTIFFQILSQFGLRFNAPDFTAQPTLLDAAVTFLSVALLAPLFEEIFFRGALLGGLRPYGDAFAVIMSGILFGLAHANYQQMFYAAAMGMLAGFLRLRTGSLWPAIGMHFTLNFIGAIQSILLSRIDLEQLDAATSAMDFEYLAQHTGTLLAISGLSLLCLALAIAGVILFFREFSRRNRENLRMYNACPQYGGAEKAEIFLTAPAILLFLAVVAVLAAMNAA